jgi:hypothetical protein
VRTAPVRMILRHPKPNEKTTRNNGDRQRDVADTVVSDVLLSLPWSIQPRETLHALLISEALRFRSRIRSREPFQGIGRRLPDHGFT